MRNVEYGGTMTWKHLPTNTCRTRFSFVPLGFVPNFEPLNHGIWPLIRVWDPKHKVTNIHGTNSKSLSLEQDS